jgi:hypothetical protein
VSSPQGTSVTCAGDEFRFVLPATITKLKPKKGPASGGTHVKISGTGFNEFTSVHFGAVAAASVQVLSEKVIEAVAPPETPGTVEVIVMNGGGRSPMSPKDRFKFG